MADWIRRWGDIGGGHRWMLEAPRDRYLGMPDLQSHDIAGYRRYL